MDSQTMFDVDNVKAEKDNAMQRYRKNQKLRWVLKACLPLAPLLSYALYRVDAVVAPRKLLVAAFNSDLCVFLIVNALIVTCFLSGESKNAGEVSAQSDIYGEYVASVGRSGTEFEETDKEIGICVSNKTTTLPEEVSEESEIDENNVDVETVPFWEDKAVIVEHKQTVVSSVSAVTTNINNININNTNIISDETQKVKSYRRTQSESFDKKSVEPTPKKKGNLVRSKTDMHRNSDDEVPEKLDAVAEKLSDEEFQHRCEFFLRKEWQRIHRPA